jgi:folate-binding protein YgfZ
MTAEKPGGRTSITVIGPADVPPDVLSAVRESAVFSRTDLAAVEVTGAGAVKCLQGLLTCDFEGAGEGSFSYGALLSVKGMIECDFWAARLQDEVILYAPREVRQRLLDALKRYIPPRLARFADVTDERVVFRFAGPLAQGFAAAQGIPTPNPGETVDDQGLRAARPKGDIPFVLQVDCPAANEHRLDRALSGSGIRRTASAPLELTRILAGWPRFGAEIDDKTLPQEVRFDAIGALSHSKGCYLGQETVSRLHFRGHTNKRLLGLTWQEAPDPTVPDISKDDRSIGRMTSVVSLDHSDIHVGLGMIRSAVEPGTVVIAGESPATTVDLPLGQRK